jgi:hypothetical protein
MPAHRTNKTRFQTPAIGKLLVKGRMGEGPKEERGNEAHLGLLMFAHDGSKNGTLKCVEGGEIQAAEPASREKARL